MKRRLYKSSNDKKIFGVCAGVAEFLKVDPAIIRVIWAFLGICYGAGILLYIICAFVLPEHPTAIEDSNLEDDIQ